MVGARYKASKPEEILARQVSLSGLPAPEREFHFHPERKWRSDFAWPGHKLLAEIEGGIWITGRHTRGTGFEKDAEKYNAAALLGYRVVRFTPGMVKKGIALRVLTEALR